MKQSLLLPGGVFLLGLILAGCVSRSELRARERAAFLEGRMQPPPATAPEIAADQITVLGPVRQPKVPWSEGLSLAQAIATAEYTDRYDPRGIVIHRGRDLIVVDPRRLLAGVDNPVLQPGDVIELRP